MLSSSARRVLGAVLAVAVAVAVAACDDGPPGGPPPPGPGSTAGSAATDRPTEASHPAGPGTTSASGPSVAPDDAAILDGLSAQGYVCEGGEGERRCRRVKNDRQEEIEIGPGRVVFVVTSSQGSVDLGRALSSVLDDYGAVLPQRSFAGADWTRFTTWADEHGDDQRASGTVAGWQVSVHTEGSTTRTLVLALP